MNEIALHPGVFATGASTGLLQMLERAWLRETAVGEGEIYLISGFGNFNGGVRFYQALEKHIAYGGRAFAVFSGSTSSRLTSKQVVHALLRCGVIVHVVNRKRLLHAKCYGVSSSRGERAIISSGNFTGPGMSQNGEMSVFLDPPTLAAMGFRWDGLMTALFAQPWDFYSPTLSDLAAPAWSLLYDEDGATPPALEDSQESTLLVTLGHADTVRINARRGTLAARGSQYFWISRDSFDFFPPLTIRNVRGPKATYSAMVQIAFIDLGERFECRVTFEAENNLDFRLGTGPLRGTRLAASGDIAAISRVGERAYELRILKAGTSQFAATAPYAVNLIGHQGKRYGYLPNADFSRLTGHMVGR